MPEWILAHVVGKAIVDSPYQAICVGHAWIGEQQKLGAGQGLKDGKLEEGRLETLDAGDRCIRYWVAKAGCFPTDTICGGSGRVVGGGSGIG